jgi:hypothetical protein
LPKTNTNDPNSIAPRHGFSMERERETGETKVGGIDVEAVEEVR